jgi:hypothetical protein
MMVLKAEQPKDTEILLRWNSGASSGLAIVCHFRFSSAIPILVNYCVDHGVGMDALEIVDFYGVTFGAMFGTFHAFVVAEKTSENHAPERVRSHDCIRSCRGRTLPLQLCYSMSAPKVVDVKIVWCYAIVLALKLI